MRLLDQADILPALAYLAAGASRSLKIASYTLSRPGRHTSPAYAAFWQAIIAAPARGVDCRLMHPAPREAGQLSPHTLQTAAELAAAGWKLREYPRARLLHAKLFQADDARAVIGSANFSEAALTSNVEIMVHTDDPRLNTELRDLFRHHWNLAG